MSNPMFRKTPLAAGVAVALGAPALPSVAVAQEGEVIEEIITTGIRGSLRASADIKRAAEGVVDAINAEDMGDFPDTNLAESLQRITGVSIQRERGEGNRVTVRGFGPQFNLVLLNGRQMPTAGGIFGAPQGNDRSFDFSNIASEGISAVEVYKSGIATVPSGGIGSTINVKSTRPLADPGLKMSFAAAGVYDDSSTIRRSTDWTGEISGIISNTFADDKFGVALTVVRQNREHGEALANVNGWRTFDGARHVSWGAGQPWGACDNPDAPADITPYIGQEEWGAINLPCFGWEGPSQHTNRPEPGELYSVPQTIGYNLSDYERTRVNGQLTLQYRPVETVTATLDYTYSEKEESRSYNDMSAWFNFGTIRSVWPEEGSNLTPSEFTEFSAGDPVIDNDGYDFSMGAGEDAFKNENETIGLNLLWDVSDRLSLEFDYHDSTAESGPDSPWGNVAVLSTAAYTRDQTTGLFGNQLPVLQLGLANTLSPDDMVITGSIFQNIVSKMDLWQAEVGGSLFFEDSFIESIDFGVELTEIDNLRQTATVQRDSWSAQTEEGAIADLLTPVSNAGSFDEMGGAGIERQTDFFLFDMTDMIARAEELIAAGDMPIFNPGNLDFGPCGTALCASDNYGYDARTTEETTAVYLQANALTEWGDMPVSMRLGLRYEQTDVKSAVIYPEYTGLSWVSGNEMGPTNNGEQLVDSSSSDYDHLLPNFDFRIDLTDELVGRVSLSKTLTRPDFEQIQGGLTIASPVRVEGGSGYIGDPSLKPLESENVDLSVEYYYGDASYASVGYFRKDVKNFIVTTPDSQTPFELPFPLDGPLGDAARAAVEGIQPPQIYSWILNNLPDAEGVDAERGIIAGVDGRDPLAVFQMSIPANVEQTVIDGWELNIQHNFGDTGFGFILNGTFADADKKFDVNNPNAQFVLPGLSDSANFIPYWENEDWSIRVAYNWRDTFLAGTGQGVVGGNGPVFVDEYEQWDLSASYWATDNLQFYADVLNLTNETTWVYGRQKDQVLFASQYGTRYVLGVRYKF